MRYSRALAVLLVLVLSNLPFAAALAIHAPLVPCGTTASGRACTFCDFYRLAKNLIEDFLFVIIFPLVALAIAVGGFYILASGGREDWARRGKDIIWNAVWGLIIALIAWLIVNTIIVFLASPGAFPWPWYRIPPNCSGPLG